MQVMVEVTQIFILQHWIEPRTITDEGYWRYDLSDIHSTLNEAQTERDEFHWECERHRIVMAEIVMAESVTKQIIEETDDRNQGPDEPALKQRELFTV